MGALTHTYCDYAAGNDYKGATFTDGAFTQATHTLTKVGAFAATKVNHWLYLVPNGGSSFTAGYFKVATVPDANSVTLATDPSAGDLTDVKCTQHDGTTSLPWRSVQGAFDLKTRDATNGDQVNVKVGTVQINQTSLNLTTYGTPTGAAPLIVRGYTTTASDGGIAEIDCNGASFWANSYPYWTLCNLQIHSFGNNNGITGGGSNYATIISCNIHKGASSPSAKTLISTTGQTKVFGCYIHDAGTGGTGIKGYYGMIEYNYVYNCPTGIELSHGAGAVNNIIVDCVTYGINKNSNTDGAGHIRNNTIYCSSAATGSGIYSSSIGGVVTNNIIEGYSGSGGKGINISAQLLMYGYNAFYNCATNSSLGDIDVTIGADVSLASSPFTNAAGGDFSLLTSVVGAIDGAFPGAWYGPASTTDHADIGAVQNGAGTGGVFRRVARLLGG